MHTVHPKTHEESEKVLATVILHPRFSMVTLASFLVGVWGGLCTPPQISHPTHNIQSLFIAQSVQTKIEVDG
jgi:hypothetical protein